MVALGKKLGTDPASTRYNAELRFVLEGGHSARVEAQQ
jgi:hypothetical protein